MSKLSLPSFAKGELSPEVQGRIDISSYNIGLSEAKNVIVHTYGGVSRRPGLKFIGECKYYDRKCRLIPFTFKSTDQYMLEVGDRYIRIIRNDGHVMDSRAKQILDITYANPAVFTVGIPFTVTSITKAAEAVVTLDSADGLEEGDAVQLSDLDGLTELESFTYYVTDLDYSTNTCKLAEEDGSIANTSALAGSAATSGTMTVNHEFVNGDDVVLSGIMGYTEIQTNRWKVRDKTDTTFKLKNAMTDEYLSTLDYDEVVSPSGSVNKVYTIYTDYQVDELFDLVVTQSADVMTFTHPNHHPMDLTRTDHDEWTFTKSPFEIDQGYPTGLVLSTPGTGTTGKWYKVTAVNAETNEESLPGLSNTSGTISAIDLTNPVKITTSGTYEVYERDEVQIDGTNCAALDGKRFKVIDYDSGTNSFTIHDMLDRPIDGAIITDLPSPITGTVTNCLIWEDGWSTDSTSQIDWNNNLTGVAYFNVYRRSGSGDYGFIGQSLNTTLGDTNIGEDNTKQPPISVNPVAFEGDEPRACSYYEQRFVLGGSNNSPDRTDYSRIGQYRNFTRGAPATASDAISAYLPSGQVDVIRHFLPYNNLLIFTEGGEWKIFGDSKDGFTVDTIQQRLQSRWGCCNVPPLLIGRTVLWVPAGAGGVRSMSYDIVSDTYDSTDVTVLARHLFKEHYITDWSWQRFPESVVFLTRSDGTALALSFNPEQEVIALSTLDTDGEFESVGTLRQNQETLGDSNFWVVQRTINGNTVRYIEKTQDNFIKTPSDMFFVDSGITYDGDPVSTISGAWHLAGADVVAIGDGDYIDNITVDEKGTIVLPHEVSKLHIGFANTARIKTLPMVGENGVLIGEFKKVYKATVKMYNSRKPWIGTSDSLLVQAKQREDERWSDPAILLSGDIEVYLRPNWTLTGQIIIEQPLPVSFSVINIAPSFETINDKDL